MRFIAATSLYWFSRLEGIRLRKLKQIRLRALLSGY